MTSWAQVEEAEPDFARRVRGIFDAHLHKTMATLRRDGTPRISGTEATFKSGELWLGMMGQSQKARDLRRDGRVAVHSATVDTELAEGDVKVSGVAFEETDQGVLRAAFEEVAGGAAYFRIDVQEVVITRVRDSKELIVELWTPVGGIREFRPE